MGDSVGNLYLFYYIYLEENVWNNVPLKNYIF